MSAISVLQGKVSHVHRLSHTAGTAEWVQTVHKVQFRVDNRPVVFTGTPNLDNGDDVTIAGVAMLREFRAYAIRNDSTGVEYLASAGWFGGAFVLVVALAFCGLGAVLVSGAELAALLAMPLFCLGIPGVLFGILALIRGRRNHEVNEALLASPALALPAHTALSTTTARRILATSEAPSLVRTIAGNIVGLFGVGLTAISLLLVVAALIDLTKGQLGTGAAVVALLLCIASGIGGVSIARRGFGKRRRPAERVDELPTERTAPAVRKRVLQIASGHGGRVTAAEVAAALAIEQEPAERVLEEAAQAGEARMLFSPEGVAVYEFSGLVTRKADAKEPWDL